MTDEPIRWPGPRGDLLLPADCYEIDGDPATGATIRQKQPATPRAGIDTPLVLGKDRIRHE